MIKSNKGKARLMFHFPEQPSYISIYDWWVMAEGKQNWGFASMKVNEGVRKATLKNIESILSGQSVLCCSWNQFAVQQLKQVLENDWKAHCSEPNSCWTPFCTFQPQIALTQKDFFVCFFYTVLILTFDWHILSTQWQFLLCKKTS